MLNHIHLMVSTNEGCELSSVMRDFKRHTSSKIAELIESNNEKMLLYLFQKAGEKKGSKMKIWQDDYHPVAIVSEKWFYEKLNYMHNNPVRKGFVMEPEDWKYSSARNWYQDNHEIISLDLDQL